MARKEFRVRWINGNARNENDPQYERKGKNCTEDQVDEVEEQFRMELYEKQAGGKTKYDSDSISVVRRDEIDD